MKKITYISLLFLLLVSTAAIGQVQITRQVIGSTGGDATGSNMSISFTVGETVIETVSNNMILTQGFHQPEGDTELGDSLIFYSGITPNNDGVNDTWIIDNIEAFPENKVQLFNRWGNEIWYGENYNNDTVVWKGSDNGGLNLVSATYFYVVIIGEKSFKGWVELTR